MSPIIDVLPSPFPANNSEEIKSVIKFLDLLDKEFIKPETKFLDKNPSTDGFITLVDQEQRPLGRFDIQIKTLPDCKISKPVHQCHKSFLRACEDSQLPVLLIVVNAKAEKAWWLHISRAFLRELAPKIKRNSITITFPIKQLISRRTSRYLADWRGILEDERNVLYEYERLKAIETEMAERNRLLTDFPKPAHSISEADIKLAFVFIDTLNDLLNRDFVTLKKLFYNDYRLLGLAYSAYQDDLLDYAIYPIKYGQNDLTLREVPNLSALMKSGATLESTTCYGSNPIKENPTKLALEHIRDDLQTALKERYIRVLTTELCQEYIADFLELFDRILRLRSQYIDLLELESYLQIFIPLWCEAYIRLEQPDFKELEFDFDPGFVLWRILQPEMNKVYQEAMNRYKNGESAQLKVFFVSTYQIDFEYLFHALRKLKQDRLTRFKRPYSRKQTRVKTGLIYDWLDKKAAFQKTKFIFEGLPKAYQQFIEGFFPALVAQLDFYNGRDLVIVNLDYPEHVTINNAPQIKMVSFVAKEPFFGSKMRIYLNGNGCPIDLKNLGHFWRKPVKIDGHEFKIIQHRGYSNDILYNHFSIHEYLYEDLKSDFEDFFKKLI